MAVVCAQAGRKLVVVDSDKHQNVFSLLQLYSDPSYSSPVSRIRLDFALCKRTDQTIRDCPRFADHELRVRGKVGVHLGFQRNLDFFAREPPSHPYRPISSPKPLRKCKTTITYLASANSCSSGSQSFFSSTYPRHPIIREAGNGQHCELWYATRVTRIPVSSRTSRRTQSSMDSPGSPNPATQE